MRAYAGLALAANDKTDLGSSGTLENDSFECHQLLAHRRRQHGCRARHHRARRHRPTRTPAAACRAAMLDDLTQRARVHLANGLFFSPSSAEEVDRGGRAAAHPRCGELRGRASREEVAIVPYGDRTLAGWGEIYTPDTAPRYDLTEDDFIAEEGEDPVRVSDGRRSARTWSPSSSSTATTITTRGPSRTRMRLRSSAWQAAGRQALLSLHLRPADVAARVANHRCLRSVHIGKTSTTSRCRRGLLRPARAHGEGHASRQVHQLATRTIPAKMPVRITEIEEDRRAGT
jgi:hypothetical protein